MKTQFKLFTTLAFFLIAFNLNAQISSIPVFPTESEALTVYFDATGTALEDYSGTVYTHTGVILQGGSSWAHVIGDWGNNSNQPSLTDEGNNIYSLEIATNPKEYYDVPESSSIKQLAFVFRTEDASAQSADLFLDMYVQELSVMITSPSDKSVLNTGDELSIEVHSSEAESMQIFLNDELLHETTENVFTQTITATEGNHKIKAVAFADGESVEDSVSFITKPAQVFEDYPAEWHEGVNYIDESTVGLVLFAPYKDFCYLIGDFNNWELNNDYFMNKSADGRYFWLTLENLTPGQEYIYQYYIDAELKIADPYTEKISDPWNDQYIPESSYPGLIDYPQDKTDQIAAVLQTNQEEYQWEVENFVPAEKQDLVIYELLVRDFTDESNFKTVLDTLDYLENLGVNAIEFMPVNEFEGNSSWGYNPSFYFALDKYYGTKNDFKALVDECHKRGMAVLIDMVYNHSYGSSPLLRMYFANGKPTSINPWYNEEHNFQNTDAHWGYDFNHESIYTQRFIDSANSYWMNEYKVDGFRFDFTKGFTNEYKDNNDPWASNYDASRVALLKRMSDEIWARNENAIVIFEHLAENSEEKVLAEYGILLWGNLNHNFNEGTMGWLENGKSDLTWSSYKERNWSEPNLVAYAESHDEQRLMYKNLQYGNATVAAYDLSSEGTAVERMELSAVFLLAVPGPKMIWQFGEMAYDVDINFDGRTSPKPTKWEYLNDWKKNYLYKVYSEMIKLKKNVPAFESTDYEIDLYGAVKRVHLNHAEGDVLVMGNWDIEEAVVNPEFQSEGWWYEYFTGDSILVEDVNAELNLAAGEYRVYSNVKLGEHDLPVSLGENQNDEHFIIYPNPAQGEFYVDIMQNESLQGDTSIRLINAFGQLVYEQSYVISEGRNKILINPPSNLPEGLYILELINQNGGSTERVILK